MMVSPPIAGSIPEKRSRLGSATVIGRERALLAHRHRRLQTGPMVAQARSEAIKAGGTIVRVRPGQGSIVELTDDLGRTTIIFDLDNTLVHSRIDFPAI